MKKINYKVVNMYFKPFMKYFVFISFSVVHIFCLNAYSQYETNLFCESEQSHKIYNFTKNKLQSTNQLTVTTWNVYKYGKQGVFNDIRKLYQQSDLLLIQEAVHTPAWEKVFVSYMPNMNWVMYKSFCQNSNTDATGVLIGTKAPLAYPKTLLSPGTEPILNTHKASGVGYLQIQNKNILIVNTHALNFNLGTDFENHIDQIIQVIRNHAGPVVWGGDFNTWNDSRMSYLLSETKKIGLYQALPHNDNRFLKLDHVFYRGLSHQGTTILEKTTSDHDAVQSIFTLD